MVSVSTLFFTQMICADPANVLDRALPQVESNNKLLIPFINIKRQDAFYNVRPTLPENKIMSLKGEMDKKIAAEVRASRALDSSA